MMNYSPPSSEEWLNYMPAVGASGGLSAPDPDPIENEQTTNSRAKNTLSSENSCANYVDANIKDSTKKQPARRRSRASKRTPMVLLNASATNFRAVVQQYTGCHSSPSSYKGPINLDFGGGNQDSNDESFSKFGYTNSFSPTGQADLERHHQQLQYENFQQFFEDGHQESFFSGGNNARDASRSTNANPATYSTTSDFDSSFVNDLGSWE